MKKWSVGISWGVSLEILVEAETAELAEQEAVKRLRETANKLNLAGVYGHTVDVDFCHEEAEK